VSISGAVELGGRVLVFVMDGEAALTVGGKGVGVRVGSMTVIVGRGVTRLACVVVGAMLGVETSLG
jgi:hypothetical protein